MNIPTGTSKIAEVILSVIKGEMSLSALSDVGIQVSCQKELCELSSEALGVVVTPSASDLAQGLLAYRARPEELRSWAFFVLAESGYIDLEKTELHPLGDLLINALWDAQSENGITESAIKVAESLMKTKHET
jgi:hypothetical protein